MHIFNAVIRRMDVFLAIIIFSVIEHDYTLGQLCFLHYGYF